MKEIPLEPDGNFAHVRGIRLRYVDWGDNGPPLLMLHGDMRTSRSWDAVAGDLRSEFHVIGLDARGHGDSDWMPRGYRYDDRVEDLAAFCESLELSDATGVGHSTGGVVMALHAARYPGVLSRLALLEPMVVVDEAFQRMVASRAQQPRRTWTSRRELHDYLKRHERAGRWREDVIRDVVEHEARELPDGSIDMKWASETFNWEDKDGDHLDLKPILRSLGLPILFVVGEERQRSFEDVRPIAADTAGFQMVVIRGTSHNMHMERPDAVSWAIKAFVSGDGLPASI
jgi:pimeloyl-ACP methyl ester carboxylesterase